MLKPVTMLAELVTVIGPEDDCRVVVELQRLGLLHQLADHVVNIAARKHTSFSQCFQHSLRSILVNRRAGAQSKECVYVRT